MIQTSLCSAFPGVEIKGPANPVHVGSQVEVVCNGSGAPPPEVMWLKDGAPLGNSSRPHPQTYMLMKSSLRLTNVWSGDEGNYTCVVSNILGNNSASFMLVVGECDGGKVKRTLEDKLFFHYPHLDNTAKDYSWIAASVVISFMVVVVVVVVVVLIAVVVKVYGHRHPQPSVKDIPSVDMTYVR